MVTETRRAPKTPALTPADAIVYFDGALRPLHEATVTVATHALHYGTGCFEGIRGYWDEAAGELYILRLPEHIDRFFRSCAILRIDLPFTPEEMAELTTEVLRQNNYRSDVYIRPIAFKSSETIKLTLSSLDDSVAIYAFPFGHYAHREGGLRVRISAWRRIDDNAIPTRAKVTGSYVNASLASDDAHRAGYDEAVLLNQDGSLAEASSSNIFLVRQGRLITPAVSENILEGITRDAVLTLARDELGLEVEERAISRSELYVADEMFLSGTGIQIEPIASVDDLPVGNGRPGPITTRLQDVYAQAVRNQLPQYSAWCTPTYGTRP